MLRLEKWEEEEERQWSRGKNPGIHPHGSAGEHVSSMHRGTLEAEPKPFETQEAASGGDDPMDARAHGVCKSSH
eukprot:5113310-Amphidinium_carterae.1